MAMTIEELRAYNNTYAKKRYRKHKALVLKHFGGRCACCFEMQEEFLTLDHVKNDGGIDRAIYPMGGSAFYSRVVGMIRRGEPVDAYQLLCRNCNWGKHINGGVCPHQENEQAEQAS